MRMQWTAQQVADLKRLWRAGKSATEIALALGVTRGAITGKLDRLGLMGRGGAMRKESPPDSPPVRRIPF